MFRAGVIGMVAAVTLVAACDGDPDPRFLIVEIVRPDGTDPLASGTATRVRILVRETPADADPLASPPEPVELLDEDPSDGFDLRLPIDDLDAAIRVHVEIETTTGASLVGAVAPFRPIETVGIVRILVAPAGSCHAVGGAYSGTPRERPAFVIAGTFAFTAGGTTADDAPSSQAEFIDLLAYAGGAMEPLGAPAAEPRALALDLAHVLVLTPEAAFVYDLRNGDPEDTVDATTPISLHDGAVEAGLAPLPSGGGVVAGGATGAALDTPSGDVTWLAADGTVTARTRLLTPRRAPAVHALADDRVLVVGGSDAAPLAELVSPSGPGVAATDAAVPADSRIHAALLPDPAAATAAVPSTRVLLAGGASAGAAIGTTTILECSAPPCAVGAGPALADASPGVTVPIPRLGGAFVGDLGGVVYLRWVAGAPAFDAPTVLPNPARVSAVALEAGTLLVLGGGPLQMCVPTALPLP